MAENKAIPVQANLTNLERVQAQISKADNKSSFLLAVCIPLIAYNSSLASLNMEMVIGNSCCFLLTWISAFILIAPPALTLIGLLKFINSLTPRVKSPTGNPSLLYFGTIAEMPDQEFEDHISSISEDNFISELVDQTIANSRIATIKYKLIGEGTNLLKYAIISTAIASAIVWGTKLSVS
jgi:hypothetical protein